MNMISKGSGGVSSRGGAEIHLWMRLQSVKVEYLLHDQLKLNKSVVYIQYLYHLMLMLCWVRWSSCALTSNRTKVAYALWRRCCHQQATNPSYIRLCGTLCLIPNQCLCHSEADRLKPDASFFHTNLFAFSITHAHHQSTTIDSISSPLDQNSNSFDGHELAKVIITETVHWNDQRDLPWIWTRVFSFHIISSGFPTSYPAPHDFPHSHSLGPTKMSVLATCQFQLSESKFSIMLYRKGNEWNSKLHYSHLCLPFA